ncbi:DUF4190 domain-containing protein [Arthrobacter oryzae]|uniref:DUF4190 domain-containing protein n=1 Tax=Arthrobacter oryzae TaxID=409290 RepID=A0A3N0BVB8_9MICC|nr:DUF4190 domain-containing protein [Arthrobacter oryzae]RNL53268.1 DUF4190 domain-containing protein [Arthrobacter oryzae]
MLLNDRRATTESRSLIPAESQVSGQGLASLVLGTFAVAVSFIPVLGLPALVLGPLAIILAYFARTGQPRDRVTATAGLILGITATVIALVVTAITVFGIAQYSEKIRSFPFAATTQAPAASATTGAAGTGRTTAASAPTPQAVPSAPTTGQPPGKNCGLSGSVGTKGGQPVTFIVEGEPGKTFNVDYGTTMEYGCVERATGRWEATMLMIDPKGAGITMWYDGGSEKNLTCQIIIDGQIVGRGQGAGCST